MTTGRFVLPELIQNQSQPHVPINKALNILDGLIHLAIIDRDLSSPPSASDGDVYLVAGGASGDWAGYEGHLAISYSSGWYFVYPVSGILAYVIDEDITIQYKEAESPSWVTFQSGSGGGGSGSTAGRHAIWVPAGAMVPSNSSGCQSLTNIATSAGQPDINSLDFDPTSQEYAQFSIRMPKSWNEGTVTFVPVWSHPSTATNFGVVWSLAGVAVSNDDPIGAAFGTAQTSTDTGGTTDDAYMGPESSAITIAGTPAAEDLVFFRVSRVATNGSDTLAVDARLHGITLYITTDADTDA